MSGDLEYRLSLYRKYRSRDFDELIGQPHVTTSLVNSLGSQRLSHAYLFAGPRGVGKTSAARILARRINNLSHEQAQGHLDIIEIDAASNRRIDEIRDLRQKVHVAPVSARYKVYIIDEAHMLTPEAFNALLKTLEEPPRHVVFILATTEHHKLPETITSRTQVYLFRPIETKQLAAHLIQIAKREKIAADPDAVELLAEMSEGSLRDGLSLLDQAATMAGSKKLSLEIASQLLGLAKASDLEEMTNALISGQPAKLIAIWDRLMTVGMAPAQILKQLLRLWQSLLRIKLGPLKNTYPSHYQKMASSLSPDQLMLMIKGLLGLAGSTQTHLGLSLEARLLELSGAFAAETVTGIKKTIAAEPMPARIKPNPEAKAKQPATRAASTTFSESGWLKALAELKTKHNSLYTLLRLARTEYHNGELSLNYRFQFHKRRIEETKNLNLLRSALAAQFGDSPKIVVSLESPQPTEAKNETVEDVLQILGGEIV